MRARTLVALLILALPACHHDLTDLYRRLQPLSVYAAGVAVTRAGYYDRQWQVACAFTSTSDGKRRCLPSAPPDDGLQFLDDHCRQPVTAKAPGPGLDAFTLVDAGDGPCDVRTTLYRRNAQTRTVATFLRKNDACVPNPDGPTLVHSLDPITDQAVEGKTSRGPAQGGLAPVFFVAEETILWTEHWHAEAQDVDCDFRLDDPAGYRLRTGTPVRCLPFAVDGDARPLFGDNGCVLPAVREDGRTCGGDERFAVLEDFSHRCPSHPRTFHLRGIVPATFSGEGGVCHPDAPGRALLLGDELPLEAWPAGQFVVPSADPRIVTAEVDTAAGRVGINDLWDQDLSLFCSSVTMADGHARCFPEDVVFLDRSAFADSACTQPLARAFAPENGCASSFATDVDPNGFPTRLFRLGARHADPAFAADQSGACAPVTFSSSDGEVLFDLAAELPLDSLALMETGTASP